MTPARTHYAPIETVPLCLPLLAVCGCLCDVDEWTTVSTNVSCPECRSRLQRNFDARAPDHMRERRYGPRVVARLRRLLGVTADADP